MKVFVFAIDGCDLGLVGKWGLAPLLQKEFGTYPALINKKTQQPMSAQIWGSFLTGQVQDFAYWQEVNKAYGVLTSRLSYSLMTKVWNSWIRPTFGSRFIRYRTADSLEGVPLYERIGETRVINFPFVDYDTKALLEQYENLDFSDLPKEVYTLSDEVERRILEVFEEDWQLLLAYDPILDGVGHVLLPKALTRARDIYRRISSKVDRLSEKLPEDTLMIILSDHGMLMTGDHSREGLYSLSEKLDWQPTGITDFYAKIVSLIEG